MYDEINEWCDKCGDYSFFYKIGEEERTDYDDAVVFSAEFECSDCGHRREFKEILYRC